MAAVLLLLLLLKSHDRLLNGAPCHQLRARARRLKASYSLHCSSSSTAAV